jgi:hypothetical protein
MAYLRLVATTSGAVTISRAYLSGNHMETASHVSGSMLRGALAALWETARLGDRDFLDLFCRGKITFHGLFPIPSGDEGENFIAKRRFPYRMPLSAFVCKYHPPATEDPGHPYVDAVFQLNTRKCLACKAPLKQCKAPEYYYRNDDPNSEPKPLEPRKEVYLYHGAERATRRARTAALYSYSSICNGEQFIGWLSGAPADLEKFMELFNKSFHVQHDSNDEYSFKLRVGIGKKRRGFLHTRMKLFPEEADFRPAFVINGRVLVVVLQTPAIVYDNLFRPVTDLDAQTVFRDMLQNYPLKDNQPFKRFSARVVVDGWSNVYRLPRKPDQALSAGSVFAYKLTNEVGKGQEKDFADKLKVLQAVGIGERRNEGYGQILVNPRFTGIGE